MLKDEKAKPDYYVYNLLIGTCGRVGYVQKAFHLFNQVCFIYYLVPIFKII